MEPEEIIETVKEYQLTEEGAKVATEALVLYAKGVPVEEIGAMFGIPGDSVLVLLLVATNPPPEPPSHTMN